jgi:folate-binding protein YgfZ
VTAVGTEGVVAYHVGRDVVLVEGPEAAAYLHGQVSQDVQDLEVGASRWSFLLEPRGNVEAFLRMTRSGPETFVLDTTAGAGDVLAASLQRFKLRTKAAIAPVDWRMLAVRGDGAAEAARAATGVELTVAVDWPGQRGVDLLGPDPRVDGVPVLGEAHWERLRVATGMPDVVADLAGAIPNETELVDLAVSFSKGCYRGQELVERISSRGAQRLLLRRLRFDQEPGTRPGDDRSLTSLASVDGGGAVGLGYLRATVEPGTTVDVGGAPATVLALLAE